MGSQIYCTHPHSSLNSTAMPPSTLPHNYPQCNPPPPHLLKTLHIMNLAPQLSPNVTCPSPLKPRILWHHCTLYMSHPAFNLTSAVSTPPRLITFRTLVHQPSQLHPASSSNTCTSTVSTAPWLLTFRTLVHQPSQPHPAFSSNIYYLSYFPLTLHP